jgi:hypothetical protein
MAGMVTFLVVQPDLDAGHPPRAFANGEHGGKPRVQLIGVLVEAVLQGLALGDEVVDRAQGHEVVARCRPVGEPGPLDAGPQGLDEPQPLAPRGKLLARALEAHLRRPRPAQKPVARQAGLAAEPGPSRHEQELVVRRAGQVRLARDPQRIVCAASGFEGMTDARKPERDGALIARNEIRDAQREVLIERKFRQRRGERLRRAAAAATSRAPRHRRHRAEGRPRRPARSSARASRRSRRPLTSANSSAGKLSARSSTSPEQAVSSATKRR